MDLGLDEEQEQLVQSLTAFFAKECPPERVRAAEPLGFDDDLWGKVVQLGLPTIGVPDALGGGGASLVDLALVADQAGRALAPVPLVDAMVATRLLAQAGPVGAEVLERVVAEGCVVAFALHPVRNGVARLVPAGAVADIVIGIDDGLLVAVAEPAPRRAPANLGSCPLADRSFAAEERWVLASSDEASGLHEVAVDEWKILTAAALSGLGHASLHLGVEYAKERRQFGVPIGSFQALAHRLADDATALEGARLLAFEAAWSAGAEPESRRRLASMAFCWIAETVEQTTADVLHVHGGMGFSLEGDPQLFFRRACAWPAAWSGVRHEYGRLADVMFGPGDSR